MDVGHEDNELNEALCAATLWLQGPTQAWVDSVHGLHVGRNPGFLMGQKDNKMRTTYLLQSYKTPSCGAMPSFRSPSLPLIWPTPSSSTWHTIASLLTASSKPSRSLPFPSLIPTLRIFRAATQKISGLRKTMSRDGKLAAQPMSASSLPGPERKKNPSPLREQWPLYQNKHSKTSLLLERLPCRMAKSSKSCQG